MKMSKRFVAAVGLGLVVTLLAAGCSKKDPRAGDPPEAAPVTTSFSSFTSG